MSFPPGGGVRIVNASLRQILMLAYEVEKFQVTGGPSWIDSERFDVLAKPPADSGADTPVQSRQRLRNLLAERFHLAMRKESKEAQVLALVSGSATPKVRPSIQGFDGISGRPGYIQAERASIKALADYLSGQLGRVVLDQTGLSGTYAYQMEWTPDASSGNSPLAANKAAESGVNLPDPTGPSLFRAIQEQLGLKLQPARAAVDVFVIERAEKPTEN
jgi:uncharacterized protein (TIGR03435 family)